MRGVKRIPRLKGPGAARKPTTSDIFVLHHLKFTIRLHIYCDEIGHLRYLMWEV